MTTGKGVMGNGEGEARRQSWDRESRDQAEARWQTRQVTALVVWLVIFWSLQECSLPDHLCYLGQICALVLASVLLPFVCQPCLFFRALCGALVVCGAVVFLEMSGCASLVTLDMSISVLVFLYSWIMLHSYHCLGSLGWMAVCACNVGATYGDWDAVPLEWAGILVWAGTYYSSFLLLRKKVERLQRLHRMRHVMHQIRESRKERMFKAVHDMSNSFNGVLFAAGVVKLDEKKQEMVDRCTQRFIDSKRTIVGNRVTSLIEGLRRAVENSPYKDLSRKDR